MVAPYALSGPDVIYECSIIKFFRTKKKKIFFLNQIFVIKI